MIIQKEWLLLKSCKETSAQMFGKKKLRSTWTEHPSHIREILLIKLSHLKDEYGEKKARALLMDALQRVGKRELGESLKVYSRYIL